MKKRLISFASALLTFSLLLTSCTSKSSKKDGKDDGGDADEEIVEVFEGYGKQLKKLSLSKIEDYAPESELLDLDLTGDEEDADACRKG